MKDFKQIFKSVKVALGMEKFEETLTLIDGTVVEVEAFEIGQVVNKMDGENKVVLEDGEYELEDGTKFTITEGLISAITPKEQMAEETPVKPDEEMINRVSAIETKITELETVITELVDIVSKITEGQTSMTADLSNQKTEMTRIAEIVDKEPATKETFKKNDKSQSEIERKLEVLKTLKK